LYLEKGSTLRKIRIISYLEKGTRFSYLEKRTRFLYLEKGRRLGFKKNQQTGVRPELAGRNFSKSKRGELEILPRTMEEILPRKREEILPRKREELRETLKNIR
jgi:hypothetical protein